jgi:hypothetical protein
VNLPLPRSAVRGLLVDGEAPASGRLVQLASPADGTVRAFTRSGEDGGFSVPFLPAGVYAITVDGQPLKTLAVDEEGEQDLGPLSLPAAPAAKGR